MLNSRAATKPERPRPVAGFEDIACAWDVALGHWCAKILPGEFYITRTDEAITTVLGSCISACIRDPMVGVGGMNHFMLPEDTTQGKSTWLDEDAGLATRYGSFAMESLVNGLLKLGARRERLEVKLFGGGHILNVGIDVGDRNIEFARRFLKTEGFSVVAEDVGLNVPRRVVYFPTTGKVRVKHLRTLDTREIAQREQQYLRKTVDKPATGEIELF
ncbi:MAG: chemoreceptor glutamine deamidase CheD [Proteobacteria bacterium]|jgi:chemotaxis protein CheD|nr:chemoreceptor glutamine deamidase CheD [Pseudomonadota bacterium]MCC6630744.1 chemoreceptor glutamine deamidase CheD [Gammaproteobacteria bacterium]